MLVCCEEENVFWACIIFLRGFFLFFSLLSLGRDHQRTEPTFWVFLLLFILFLFWEAMWPFGLYVNVQTNQLYVYAAYPVCCLLHTEDMYCLLWSWWLKSTVFSRQHAWTILVMLSVWSGDLEVLEQSSMPYFIFVRTVSYTLWMKYPQNTPLSPMSGSPSRRRCTSPAILTWMQPQNSREHTDEHRDGFFGAATGSVFWLFLHGHAHSGWHARHDMLLFAANANGTCRTACSRSYEYTSELSSYMHAIISTTHLNRYSPISFPILPSISNFILQSVTYTIQNTKPCFTQPYA